MTKELITPASRFGTSSALLNKYFPPAAYALNTIIPTMLPQRQQYKRPQSYTMTMTKRKKRTQGKQTSLRNLIRNTAQACHRTIDDPTFSSVLKHNSTYSISPTQLITQGTGITNRLGDSVYLCALKLNGLFTTTAVTGCFTFRILVGYSGEEASASSLVNTALGSNNVFLASTGSTILTNAIVNPKTWTSLYDEVIEINSSIASAYDWQRVTTTIPLNKVFPYQSAASIYGKDKNLYVIVIGSVLGGVSGTTDVGTATFSADLIFKNSS